MKVLIVDDSPDIVEIIRLCINMRWPVAETIVACDGSSALEMVEAESPDLALLDIGLPDMDGFQVLQRIRQFSQVPVIMLTVRDQDTDIARALQLGADDYVTKPFSHIEFLARMEAVLRRASGQGNVREVPLSAGDLWVDFEAAEVLVSGSLVQLTGSELRLLARLMYNAGRVVTHQSLGAAIWGIDDNRVFGLQTVKVHLQHLRQKLGDPVDSPRYISSVYGVGYKFIPKVVPSQRLQPDSSEST
ncbi:MAG: response regulator transcription factor [Chloroflexi bacterium]|nr:response regulator transcription factor [Chloroflexota bacterium]